uniref:Uncharacterized protein n=1 Tax=Anopheles coluzzii TaxID=1518534 RepID=A0A8W7P9G7_ANOCL
MPAWCSAHSKQSCWLASLSKRFSLSTFAGTCSTFRISTRIRSMMRPSASLRKAQSWKKEKQTPDELPLLGRILRIVAVVQQQRGKGQIHQQPEQHIDHVRLVEVADDHRYQIGLHDTLAADVATAFVRRAVLLQNPDQVLQPLYRFRIHLVHLAVHPAERGADGIDVRKNRPLLSFFVSRTFDSFSFRSAMLGLRGLRGCTAYLITPGTKFR